MTEVYLVPKDELYHYGVKGMKWGVRKKYYNSDGSLNDKGIKKYATKGYAKDSYNRNTSRVGKVWDRYTGAHKIDASLKYDTSSKNQNKARAEKYLKEQDKQKAKNIKQTKKSVAKATKKGAQVASKLMMYSLIDDIFWGGAGKKITKGAIKVTGRAATEAYLKRHGSISVTWLD